MSRSKKRSVDELEQLRSENRELKQINKSLQREIKSLKKEYRNEFEQEELVKEEVKEKRPDGPKCSECGKCGVKITPLGIKKLLVCNSCGARKTVTA